jgi:hypothetical protein
MLSLIFENLYLVLEINLIFKVGFYSIDKKLDIFQVNNKFRNSIKY